MPVADIEIYELKDVLMALRKVPTVEGNVPSRSIQIDLDGGKLRATDGGSEGYELHARPNWDPAIGPSGPNAVFVETGPFYELVKELKKTADSDESVLLSIEENNDGDVRFSVNYRDTTFNLRTVETDYEFQDVEIEAADEREKYIDAFERLLPSVDDETSARRNLQGVYFDDDDLDDEIKAVATDGHRLRALPGDFEDKLAGTIVAKKGLDILTYLDGTRDKGERIGFGYPSDSQIAFGLDKYTLVAETIDGTFPDFRQVLPDGEDRTARIRANKSEFLTQVKTAGIAANEKTDKIAISVDDSQRAVIEAASNEKAMDAEASIDGSVECTESFEAGYNYEYLVEAIETLDGDKLTIDVHGTKGPTILTTENAETGFAVVMPLVLD